MQPAESAGGTAIDPDTQRMFRAALRYSAVGLERGVAVAGGYLLGLWLDGKFDTEPWISLGGLLLGSATGFRGLIRVAQEASRESEAEDADERRRRQVGDDEER